MKDVFAIAFIVAQSALIGATIKIWLSYSLAHARRVAIWIIVVVAATQFLYLGIQSWQTWKGLAKLGNNGVVANIVLNFTVRGLVEFIMFGVVAVIVFFLIFKIRHARKEVSFMTEREVLMLTANSMIVGWPGIFIFLALTFVFSLVWMILLVILRRRTLQDRIEIGPAIIPAALVSFVFRTELLQFTGLFVIRI